MSTTHCETGIVRIRVGLFNDILRFVRALCIILHGESYNFILNCRHTTTTHTTSPNTHKDIHNTTQTYASYTRTHTHIHTQIAPPPPPGDAIHIIKRHSYTDTSHKAYKHTNAHHTSHKKTHYTYTLHETALTHTRTHLSYRDAQVWYLKCIPNLNKLGARASLQLKLRFWCISITNLLVSWDCGRTYYIFHNSLCLFIK